MDLGVIWEMSVYGCDGELLHLSAAVNRHGPNTAHSANAAHIVRCVNSHSALVTALGWALDWIGQRAATNHGAGGDYQEASAALAKAQPNDA